VAVPGYKTFEQHGLLLNVGRVTEVNIGLVVGTSKSGSSSGGGGTGRCLHRGASVGHVREEADLRLAAPPARRV